MVRSTSKTAVKRMIRDFMGSGLVTTPLCDPRNFEHDDSITEVAYEVIAENPRDYGGLSVERDPVTGRASLRRVVPE